ncbi:MAG: hypothetical protein AB7V18_19075 [Pyrinomonadaceae bacterium]
MATRITFTTKSANWTGAKPATVDLPLNIEDTDLIEARYGSLQRVFEVANRGWVISCQNGMRKRDWEAAAAYAQAYCDDGSRDVQAPTMSQDDIEAGGFTPEQLAIMKARGMKFGS